MFPSASHRVGGRSRGGDPISVAFCFVNLTGQLTKLGSPRGPLVRLGHPIGDYLANKELISERECYHQVKELAPSRDESAESKLFTRLSNSPFASTLRVLVITLVSYRRNNRKASVATILVRGNRTACDIGLQLRSQPSILSHPPPPCRAL